MPISSGAESDQLGDGAVATQVRPDAVAESALGAQLDLRVDRLAAHGAAQAIDSKVPPVLTVSGFAAAVNGTGR